MLLLVNSLQVTLVVKFANLIVFKLKKYIIKIGSASTAQSSRIFFETVLPDPKSWPKLFEGLLVLIFTRAPIP